MTDIDKAREVAQNIKNGFIITDPHGDARLLADGFLALDEWVKKCGIPFPDNHQQPSTADKK